MSEPRTGTLFAGYRILEECGHGAYGRVYLAEDAVGRRVALKYLPVPQEGEYELRGLRNYMSVAAPSDGLLRVLHCGLDESGCLFYVMEAADNAAPSGEGYRPDTLARRLRRRSGCPPTRRSRWRMRFWTVWNASTRQAWCIATSSRRTSSS